MWDGNRQVQEYTTDHVFTTVYEQDSFVPVARIVQLASHLEQKRLADIAYETRRFVRIGESDEVINQRIADKSQPILKIYHYHCNHLGTPQELSDDKGDIVWLSYDRAWGGSFDSLYKQQFVDNFAVKENELQPFKFQGQTLDIETGLHYNRFRYYDSDVGMFVSRDPIGLEGGDNVFAYAPNPVMWIDPFGLAGDIKTATHVTYIGYKGGKPYIGYASMQGCKTASQVIRYRYNSNFDVFDANTAPLPLYVGYGEKGKLTARGLEQRYFELYEGNINTKQNLLKPNNTANAQNPVGINHSNWKNYMDSADKHLSSRGCDKCKTIPTTSKPTSCK